MHSGHYFVTINTLRLPNGRNVLRLLHGGKFEMGTIGWGSRGCVFDGGLTNVKITLVAPFGASFDISCRTLARLIRFRVTGNASCLIVLNAANRAPALASRRGTTVMGRIVGIGGNHLPLILKVKKGGAVKIIRRVHHASFSGVSTVLDITPCCGGPSRRNLCHRCGTVTSSAGVPVVLCGIPKQANIGVSTSAALHLTRRFSGVITVGRTSNGFGRVSSVVRGGPRGFLIVSNSSTVAFPLVALNTTNIVSIINGTFPGRFDHVIHLTLENSLRNTHTVRCQFIRVGRLLFISNGPTNIGDMLSYVNCVRGVLHLPLIPAAIRACRGVSRLLHRLVS